MALNKFVIAAIAETTYGVDGFGGVAPTTWLAIDDAPTFQHLEGMVENIDATASDSGRPHEVYGLKSTLSFDMKLTGKTGAVGTGPHWGQLAEASGMKLTLNPAVDSRLAPTTEEKKSCTIYLGLLDDTDDSVVYAQKFLGWRGNLSANGTAGEGAKLSFAGEALYHTFNTTTAARPTLPEAYSGEKSGLVMVNATHQVGGTGYCIESWEWALNRELKEDRCATSANLVDEIYLDKGTRAGGSLTFKGRSTILAAILPLCASGATATHKISLTDGTDTVSFESPKVQIGQASWAKDGRWTFDVPYYCNGDWGTGKTGDNETVIIFT